jgi:hypothetical protein
MLNREWSMQQKKNAKQRSQQQIKRRQLLAREVKTKTQKKFLLRYHHPQIQLK